VLPVDVQVLLPEGLEKTIDAPGFRDGLQPYGEYTARRFFDNAWIDAAARQHRWARGDWQLLPWILRTPMPLIGRWKMLDNLRRTLSAPATVATLVAGWVWSGASPIVWTAFILATIALPAFLSALAGVMPRGRGISKRSHAHAVGNDFAQAASQTALTITMLAHQAWLMSDAIVRTLARVYVTRRNLLEWVTAAQAKAISL